MMGYVIVWGGILYKNVTSLKKVAFVIEWLCVITYALGTISKFCRSKL